MRPFAACDIDFLDELHGDPLVMRYILGRVRTHDENMAYLDRLLDGQKDHGIGQRLVICKEDNRPVGRCGMSFFYGLRTGDIMSYELDPKAFPAGAEVTRVTELGYTFLHREWGKGYASEAAAAMRDYGLNIQKFPELHSIIMRENTGSLAVAEKIGAKLHDDCFCLGRPARDYVSKLT